jgi:CheY-like chemotaxis protein
LETHKEKILVVDDEASIRRILETRLSMIGYDVVTAADGEEALETFRNSDPDLVVLDVMMSGAAQRVGRADYYADGAGGRCRSDHRARTRGR